MLKCLLNNKFTKLQCLLFGIALVRSYRSDRSLLFYSSFTESHSSTGSLRLTGPAGIIWLVFWDRSSSTWAADLRMYVCLWRDAIVKARISPLRFCWVWRKLRPRSAGRENAPGSVQSLVTCGNQVCCAVRREGCLQTLSEAKGFAHAIRYDNSERIRSSPCSCGHGPLFV